jgi:chemotaxis protein methyltransferase CheR
VAPYILYTMIKYTGAACAINTNIDRAGSPLKNAAVNNDLIGDHELETLLDDLLELYGYDFTGYSPSSLKRRISRLLVIDRIKTIEEFKYRLKNDEEYADRFIEEVTVNVTEMFRDPSFFKLLRTQVIPELASYPLIKVWHAGCSSGEEVFSTAIILHEANLLHKSLLYATDINPRVIEMARSGILPLGHMRQYSENYIKSGGMKEFSSYYTANYNKAVIRKELLSRTVFSTHNLVSDRSFNEFHLIMCRNVMIYFNKGLQDRVLKLFDESLEPSGFLGLGTKETLKFSSLAPRYKQVEPKEKLWRKAR